ncbi:MAG: hypothetical protein NTZ16_11590, partial [Verrucomicrobia bacterium]|nr:hypothetical protein [Verrucomicrobiota bacterium]
MQDAEIAADDDAGAAQFAQHVGHHLVVGGDLVVEPDVLDGEAELLEQVENEFEFVVGERFAGEAAVEHGDADEVFAIEDGDGDLGAEEFKFFLGLDVVAGAVAVAAADAAGADELAADAD